MTVTNKQLVGDVLVTIAHITIVVRDYDEALAFYVGKLGFSLVEDTPLGDDKRWVRVAPPGGAHRIVRASRRVP